MAEAAAHAQPAWVLRAYLIAGVCFILALRGLSSPESSQRGNRLGMIGMAIAVGTTLMVHMPRIDLAPGDPVVPLYDRSYWDLTTLGEIAVAIAIGATIGLVTARKIQLTAMPQHVAAD